MLVNVVPITTADLPTSDLIYGIDHKAMLTYLTKPQVNFAQNVGGGSPMIYPLACETNALVGPSQRTFAVW
jgi:hypothetical protein